MLNIDSLQNGIVIDHIKAGTSMMIYDLLDLGELDCCVAIIKNARSEKVREKDIIKIDGDIDIDLKSSDLSTAASPSTSSATASLPKRRSWSCPES